MSAARSDLWEVEQQRQRFPNVYPMANFELPPVFGGLPCAHIRPQFHVPPPQRVPALLFRFVPVEL